MADHNFTTDTYDANTAILDECKAHIAETVLPSDPASQFDDGSTLDRMAIDAINSVLGKVSQIVETSVSNYSMAKTEVINSDGSFYSKLNDSVDNAALLLNALCKMNSIMSTSFQNGVIFFYNGSSSNLVALLSEPLIPLKLRDYVHKDKNGNLIYDWDAIAGLIDKEFYTDEDMVIFTNIIDSLVVDNEDGTSSFSDNFIKFCNCFYNRVDFDLHDMLSDEYIDKYFGDKFGTDGYDTAFKCLFSQEGLKMMLESGWSNEAQMIQAIKEQYASGYLSADSDDLLYNLLDLSGMREGTATKYADTFALIPILMYYKEHGLSVNRDKVADYIEQITSVEYSYDVKLCMSSKGKPMSISINGSEYIDMWEHNWNESTGKFDVTQRYSPYDMILHHAGDCTYGTTSTGSRIVNIDSEIGLSINYDRIEVINSRDLYDEKGRPNASLQNDKVVFESFGVSASNDGNDEIVALITSLKEEDSYLVDLIETLKRNPSCIDEKGWEKVVGIIGDGFKEISPIKAVSKAGKTVKKVIPGIELATELEKLNLNNDQVDKIISSLKAYDSYEKDLDRIRKVSQALGIESCRIISVHEDFGDHLGFQVSIQNVVYDKDKLYSLVNKYNSDSRHTTKINVDELIYALENGDISNGGIVDNLSNYIENTSL